MSIGIIGDLHWREDLGHANSVADHRIPEQKEILDFIVKNLFDCNTIVFMGDQLNGKNNSSKVIKEFVNFLEQFKGKKLFILSGNHEQFGDGRSAIDFLREISDKRWEIITKEVFSTTINKRKMVFCPWFTKPQLEVDDDEEGKKVIMENILTDKADILFVHHTISDALTHTRYSTNLFREIVLPKKELEKKYKMIFAGHIHSPQTLGKTIIVGGIFNSIAGEIDKYIWKLNEKDLAVQQIKLPGRSIYNLENPTDEELSKIKKENIIKVVLTKKLSSIKIGELKEKLKRYDGYILIEQIPRERKKMHYSEGEGLLEMPVEQLLAVYAKEKNISLPKLQRGFELIK